MELIQYLKVSLFKSIFIHCSVYCSIPLKIRVIDRKQEVPHDGPMCDLLWSDPEGNVKFKLKGGLLIVECFY